MQVLENQIFLSRYIIKEILGSGSFGHVYRLEHIKNSKNYALKVDRAEKGNVMLEAKVLSEFQHTLGIPKLYKSGDLESYSYMIVELLGPTLNKLLKICQGRFSLPTVILVIKQLVQRLEQIHKKGYLHRDIKPQQILIGQNKQIIYLTDFGLARKFEMNSYHISYQTTCHRIGNATFSSLNNHSGIRQSRRDDLESLAYLTFYFLKGSLPWQLNRKVASSTKWQEIFMIKKECKIQELALACPKEFAILLGYARSLKFDEKPDYAYCLGLIDSISNRENLKLKFDWIEYQEDLDGKERKEERKDELNDDCSQIRNHRRARRSKTTVGLNSSLNRDCLRKQTLNVNISLFDESTYNNLETTTKNVWTEFKNKEFGLQSKNRIFQNKDSSMI